MIYGYHRTSTHEQHLDRGINEIENYCREHGLNLEKIVTDQQTGKNFDRPRYKVLKEDILRSGDTLIITELDRLGRNKQATMQEIQYYKEHGIRLMVLELPTTLTDTSCMNNEMSAMMLECISNMMLELYASMAQAEMQKKEKRQREGIQAKKDRGEWSDYGRPAVMSFERFEKEYQKVLSGELKPFELMKELEMTKPTYYRYRTKYHELHK